jgi:hypothetical protein
MVTDEHSQGMMSTIMPTLTLATTASTAGTAGTTTAMQRK